MFRPEFETQKTETYRDNWHLTINSNKAAKTDEEANMIRNELRRVIEQIFEEFPNYIIGYYSKKVVGNSYYRNHPVQQPIEELVTNVKVIPKFEIGGYGHKIHAHILISFESSTDYIYRIETKALNEWIHNNIGALYLYVRHVPNGTQNVLEYIFKSQDLA